MSGSPCCEPSSILLKPYPLFHLSGDGGHHPPGAHPVRHAARHRRAVLGDRDAVAEAVPGGGVLGAPGEGELGPPGGGELGAPGEAVAGASHHFEHHNKMCCARQHNACKVKRQCPVSTRRYLYKMFLADRKKYLDS